jgi:tetratricopeptide (TPR) repeat protein
MQNFRLLAGAVSSASFLFAAQGVLAAGDEDTAPPAKTQTTQDCFAERQWDPELKKYVKYSQKVNGVWDPNLKRCIRPDKAGYLKSDLLEDAVRELAYAGRNDEAQMVLAQMDQISDFVLTYWGFTHRKLGDAAAADQFYTAAIEKNPDNILARSYMGQGKVAEGDVLAAIEQLREIRSRGGSDTWAEVSLVKAIATGVTYNY